jgi:hypothetical protein
MSRVVDERPLAAKYTSIMNRVTYDPRIVESLVDSYGFDANASFRVWHPPQRL